MNDSLNSSLDLFQPDDFIPHDEKENFSHKGDILSPSRVVLATQALARTTPCGSASAKIRRKSALNTQFSSPLLKSNERQEKQNFYGLSGGVRQLFKQHRGIEKLYDWQNECLNLSAVLNGENLIYSLPTSGGKTLVAEILILRELLLKGKDALLILPFVSIVQEKVRALSPFAADLDFMVEEYAGARGSFPPHARKRRRSLYIATIEKADSLVNSLVEEKRLDSLGLLVVDELHMIGEGSSRGAVLEMTLTKVMYLTTKLQIIGMSATLSNISQLCTFLNATLYTSNFRPVELEEFVKVGDCLFVVQKKLEESLKMARTLVNSATNEEKKADPDNLTQLVKETIPDFSCLIFCATKKNCESVATLLCKFLPSTLRKVKVKQKVGLVNAIRHEGSGTICPILRKIIPYGLAYHHSGLTMDERKLIEEAYLEGTLCLLCCTSTLAAGVNLPAKRVILRSPYVGDQFMSRSQYKQMTGRAGRAGFDSSGESIVIVNAKDKLKVPDLVTGPCDVCRSCLLYESGKGLRRLLLAVVGLKVIKTKEDLFNFISRTFCYVQKNSVELDLQTVVIEALAELQKLNLVITVDDEYRVTKLGRAVYKGSVDLERGNELYKDLCRAQQALNISTYLHLLYLVTPYEMVGQVQPKWMTYMSEMGSLSEEELKVTHLLGVDEGYVTKMASGGSVRRKFDDAPIKRFYLTLILYGLWKQKTVWELSERFGQSRGFVQSLLSSAASFASSEFEEFWGFQDLFSTFVKRLSFCVTAELIPLMEINGVKMGRARQLYNAGFSTVQSVAFVDPEILVRKIDLMPRKVARQITAAAQMLLAERAETLLEEANEIMAAPTQHLFPGEETNEMTFDSQSSISSDVTNF